MKNETAEVSVGIHVIAATDVVDMRWKENKKQDYLYNNGNYLTKKVKTKEKEERENRSALERISIEHLSSTS